MNTNIDLNSVQMVDSNSELLAIKGIRLGTTCANIKQKNRKDLVLIELSSQTNIAAVFTQNKFCAAPVSVSKQHLELAATRYLLINTGNANAGTGQRGLEDTLQCCAAVAKSSHCKVNQVLPFSTGVIGENLALDKILPAIPDVFENLSDSAQSWDAAAQGIMTTDTVTKTCSAQITIQNKKITITGIAKGSGMIRPDMATMLAYIASDAKIAPALLQDMLQIAVRGSFNRITVDGDTSTNDSCLLMATGSSDIEISSKNNSDSLLFQDALNQVCESLAKDMIRDAEGASKLITIKVVNGANEAESLDLAYLIAHSPLVKTAFFASDPNWGRILAVVGRAQVSHLELEKIKIYLDDLCIVSAAGRDPHYTEQVAKKIMAQTEITICIDLAQDITTNHAVKIWTCDFSSDYVRINAEYRT